MLILPPIPSFSSMVTICLLKNCLLYGLCSRVTPAFISDPWKQGPGYQRSWWSSTFPLWPSVCHLLSHVWFFATPWTVVHQAPLVHGILEARILEWVATPFSRWSSLPSDQTRISCTEGGFFPVWTTREAHIHNEFSINMCWLNEHYVALCFATLVD